MDETESAARTASGPFFTFWALRRTDAGYVRVPYLQLYESFSVLHLPSKS